MKISPRYTDVQWASAFTGSIDWGKAIDIVENRINGRWLECVDKISDSNSSGFAVLVLDCIILESLWGFKHGESAPKGKEKQTYQKILTSKRFNFTLEQCEDFRKFVRNGLMHDAETRKGWLVEKTIPREKILEPMGACEYRINRTKFHEAVKMSVVDWIKELRDGKDTNLREKMKTRMDQIIKVHYS